MTGSDLVLDACGRRVLETVSLFDADGAYEQLPGERFCRPRHREGHDVSLDVPQAP
jgi:hypothetical protein